jgi:hypothetical protein
LSIEELGLLIDEPLSRGPGLGAISQGSRRYTTGGRRGPGNRKTPQDLAYHLENTWGSGTPGQGHRERGAQLPLPGSRAGRLACLACVVSSYPIALYGVSSHQRCMLACLRLYRPMVDRLFRGMQGANSPTDEKSPDLVCLSLFCMPHEPRVSIRRASYP